MRVLHVYQSFPPEFVGGLEESIRQICCATAVHGVENTVYYLTNLSHVFAGPSDPCAYKVTPEKRMGVLWSCALPTPRAFWRLRVLFKQADLVHFHLPWPICDLAGLLLNHSTPAIATYHADIHRQRAILPLYAPIQNRFLARLSGIVATSPEYAESSDVLRRFRGKTRIIPLCLSDSSTEIEAPTAAEVDTVPRFVLFVGVLRYYKGIDVLLDAARHVKCQIRIAGDGPLREHIALRVANERLSNVHILGSVSEEEKQRLIFGCAALVLPSTSRAEAFGMVLLEAMRAAKPTITTNIASGMRFVQGYGEGGILVPPADPQALGAAINQIVDSPRSFGDQLGRSGQKRYAEHFTPQRVGASYSHLYREIVDQSDR